MQAVIETIFDAVYLVSVITIGILMIRGSKGNKQFRLFGLMAVVLGVGDSFHLIPRALALCTTGLENYTVALGLGKWITSVTMTIFYVLLFTCSKILSRYIYNTVGIDIKCNLDLRNTTTCWRDSIQTELSKGLVVFRELTLTL